VAFAEVERFLDTPVKRYSSGMYVRLAFAVAAHLEPEILIVDEVLAVGDAQFQKKCLGKMEDVAEKEGRTVLFVSHNMTAVQSMCNQVIWLKSGEIRSQGSSGAIVFSYCSESFSNQMEQTWESPSSAPGNEAIRLRHVGLVLDKEYDTLTVETPLRIEFEYWNFLENAELNISFVLSNIQEICVFNAISKPAFFSPGLISSVCYIPGNFLNNGAYKIRLLIVKDTSTILLDMHEILTFEISDTERYIDWYGEWIGAVRPLLKWKTTFSENSDRVVPISSS
jgi:lipopolysaccharide transport system ATP-binding protein